MIKNCYIYSINEQDGKDRTILHQAVIENKTEFVQILRELNASKINYACKSRVRANPTPKECEREG